MSDFFKKNNNESVQDLFNKRIYYRVEIEEPSYPNLKDFLFAEKYLYGRVNRNYVPIEVSTEFVSFKSLPTTNKGDQNGFQVISFVADAFNDLNMQFRKAVMSGKIRADDQFLTTLEVNKAFKSPRTQYRYYYAGIKKGIVDIFRSRELKFRNFNEFMLHMQALLPEIIDLGPFSYPAFIKSRLCTMDSTGLVIEIASESCSNDAGKIEKFKNSKNWHYYLNACRSYGFSVDLNNPWRLVADIGTPEMIQYARKYNYLSTDSILNLMYVPAHRTFYENFPNILLEIYNATKRQFVEVEYCQDGTTRTHVVEPKNYTLSALTGEMDQVDFFKMYMKIRLMEEKEANLNEQEKTLLQRDLAGVCNLRTPSQVASIFENFIAETYKNSGSLTDYLNRVKVREQERKNVLSNT